MKRINKAVLINFNKGRGLMLLMSLIGLCCLSSCSYSQQQDEIQTVVKLKPGKTNRCCLVGAPVILEAGVKNTSEKTGNYVMEGLILQHFEFSVTYGEDNIAIPKTRYGESLSKIMIPATGIRTLKPGEEYVEEVPINRLFDFSMSGAYHIRGRAKSSRSEFDFKWSPVLDVTMREP